FLSCHFRPPSRARLRPDASGSFFKILDRAFGLGMVAWPGREFTVAHGAQFPAERLLGDGDAELLEDPLRKIDQPPANDVMDRRNWAALDHSGDRLALGVIELGRLPRRLTVQQPVGPPRVKSQHPVPDDLTPNTANLRRLGGCRTVVECSKRQHAPGWRRASIVRRIGIRAALICEPQKSHDFRDLGISPSMRSST